MSTPKPDILFIVLDTLRRDRLSAYGHKHETSPHFDEFASQATLFERAVAPAQWTIPSHMSMFTGVYPSTHQVTQANHTLSGAFPTLPEILQVGGYHTAGFCNNPLVGVVENGLKRGFTDFFNYAGAAVNRPLEVHKNGARRALSKRWREFARVVSTQFTQSDWLFRVSLNPRLTPIWTHYINYKGHTQNSIDDVIAYTQQHQQTPDRKPLFTFLNLMGTHLPYHPPHDYLHKIAPQISRDKHAFKWMSRFNADAARWASPIETPISAEESAVIDSFYNAELAHQDYHVGRLLRALHVSGALENTMVILVADHGEGHGDHQFFGHSFVVYQELVHVPLVIHYPAAFPPGKRIKTNVSTRRIFHTVLEAAGLTPPLDEADPNANVHGLSLARTLNGHPDTEGGLAFAEAFPPSTLLSLIRHRQPELVEPRGLSLVRRGLYDGGHKLVMVGDSIEGLFDIEHDPAEMRDLAPEQGETAQALQGKMNAFVQQVSHNGTADTHSMNDAVMENLRALGYIE